MGIKPIIEVNWPAPANVKTYSTTRLGGVSEGPYASLNLATHVADTEEHVRQNRARLVSMLDLPCEPLWLNQTHSNKVINYSNTIEDKIADACITTEKNQVCIIMAADCVPILLCNQAGTEVAAIHAGWRGLQAGIIDQTIKQMATGPDKLLAWIGPAIGVTHYQLNAKIRELFINKLNKFEEGFKQDYNKNWFANMHQLAHIHLHHCGISAIYGEAICTYSDPARFFSYRRDNTTGRMASLIYLT